MIAFEEPFESSSCSSESEEGAHEERALFAENGRLKKGHLFMQLVGQPVVSAAVVGREAKEIESYLVEMEHGQRYFVVCYEERRSRGKGVLENVEKCEEVVRPDCVKVKEM